MAEIPLRILLFVEGRTDASTVEALVDRALAEHEEVPRWVADDLEVVEVNPSPEQIASRGAVRVWITEALREEYEAAEAYIDVHHLVDFADSLARRGSFRRTRGHFNGVPGKDAAKLGRKAFNIAEQVRQRRRVDATIVVQDMDTDPSRCAGLKQARDEAHRQSAGMALVVGCPDQCREAWVTAAFEPQGAGENKEFEEVCNALRFDPCTSSHRLHHDERRSDGAKPVLARLTKGDPTREQQALRTVRMDKLRARGSSSGLEAFLQEVDKRLCPLLRES